MPSITDLDFLLRRPSRCEQAANRVRVAKDVELPVLKDWNYSPCLEHELWEDDEGTVHRDKPKPGCRRCAIIPRKHQRVGAMWLLLKKKALLADQVGLGKTAVLGLTIAMVHELGEMSRKRVLVICRAPAVLQHVQELRRMMPGLNITAAIGPKKKRQITYAQRWDVLVIGQQMVLSDEEYLSQFDFAAIFADDVDAIRNRRTKTSQTWRTLTATCPRVYVVSATPLQKRLPEMYAVTEQIGGREIFGSEWAFKSRYLQTQSQVIRVQGGNRRQVQKEVGVRNMGEFRQKVGPLVLRRTAADVDDIDMPEISPNDVFLELYPGQRAKYKELQQGILKIVKEGKVAEVKHAEAMAKFIYGAQICSGLATIGEDDGPGASIKLDWAMEQITGDFAEDKIVVFSAWKNGVRALQSRLAAEGIGYVTIWGEDRDAVSRMQSQEKFWNDDRCRVLIGTTAIEQSLNLQVARHLINIDMIMNPKRMEQLAGRLSRAGSAHHTVYVHNLLTVDTQEERYLPVLEREAALSDSLFGTQNELFAPLSAGQLLNLISE